MKKWIMLIIGISLGAIAGYLYWYFVGCQGGTCPISSSPVNSTLYGGLIGGLSVHTFRKTSPDQYDKTKHENPGNML